MSIPSWNSPAPLMGLVRAPNPEVIGPATGNPPAADGCASAISVNPGSGSCRGTAERGSSRTSESARPPNQINGSR